MELQLLQQFAPIVGISNIEADPAQWRLDFADEATAAQREAAMANIFTVALIAARNKAITEVNRQAGEARSRIGTNIPFQGDMYQMKGEEAYAYPADPAPSADKYPLAYAEAQARGMTVEAVVAEYCYNAVMWPRLLAAIEAVRMAAITAIKSAASIGEIEAALVAMEWPV